MPIDIILFAAIAVFFVWKLRQVLGTRTGEERDRPNPFEATPDQQNPDASPERDPTVIDSNAREVPLRQAIPSYTPPSNSLAGGLAQVQMADPAFDEKKFLSAARNAYTMIVEAFAKGERPTLEMLLAKNVYEGFAAELDRRAEAGEELTADVKKIVVAEISAARVEGNKAVVSVDFTSEQISFTKNRDGEIVDGDSVRPIEVSETWIFERDVTSNSPAWHLAGTRAN